jgi:ribonuclease HII
VLSYGIGEDSKIFKSGSMKLTIDIDGTAENLNIMLAAIEDRAVQNGWLDSILNIYNG